MGAGCSFQNVLGCVVWVNVKSWVRRVPFKLREKVEAEITKMFEQGVIERSEPEWCSPIVPACGYLTGVLGYFIDFGLVA